MNKILLPVLCSLLLIGCDYTVPLVTKPAVAIDRSVIGLWQNITDEKEDNKLTILPLSDTQYLLAYPEAQKHTMYARATLWQEKGMSLVQLDWFGTAQGITPDDRRTFQYARYRLDGDTLRISLVDTTLVPKTIASTQALAKAIRQHRDDPALYREEMVFTRIAADD